jgi:signal transduction histidine kinase
MASSGLALQQARMDGGVSPHAQREAAQALALLKSARLRDAVKRVTELAAVTLSVPRVGVWIFDAAHAFLQCADLYLADTGVHEEGLRLGPRDRHPRYFAAIEQQRTFAVADASSDPRTVELGDAYLQPADVRALLVVPVWLEGEVVGAACYEQIGRPRAWSVADCNFAAHVADMVSVALASQSSGTEERSLEERQERWLAHAQEAALSQIAEAVFVLGVGGDIVLSNRAASQLCDLGPDALRGVRLPGPLLALEDEQGRVPDEEHPAAQALRGEWSQGPYRYRTGSGGLRNFEVTAAPLEEAGRTAGAVLVMRDETAASRLAQAQDELLAAAADELRAPAAVIRGYAEVLERVGGALPLATRKLVHAIEKGTDEMGRTIDLLSDAAAIGAGRLATPATAVELLAVVQQAVAAVVEQRGQPDVHLVDAQPATVLASERRVLLIAATLLGRAAGVTPPGSRVEVRVRREEDVARVEIDDQGGGIAVEDQPRVFDRVNVALWLSRELVRRYGGELDFVNRPGQGATFYFTLPLAPA